MKKIKSAKQLLNWYKQKDKKNIKSFLNILGLDKDISVEELYKLEQKIERK